MLFRSEKLWAGRWLCPVEDYVILVDYGQVKVVGGQRGSRSNSTLLYTIPGEPVRAPASGVVVLAQNLALTGNTVVIDHGCGMRSYLYGLADLHVQKGQTVAQGDVVGYVGTTGRSTGNHLHFEIRVNGSRTDPLNYFSDLTLYYRSGGQKVQLDLS